MKAGRFQWAVADVTRANEGLGVAGTRRHTVGLGSMWQLRWIHERVLARKLSDSFLHCEKETCLGFMSWSSCGGRSGASSVTRE